MKRTALIAAILAVLPALMPAAVRADALDDFASAQQALSQKAAESQSLADELRSLDATIAGKQAKLDDVTRRTNAARAKLDGINAELTNLQDDYVSAQRRLGQYIRIDYMGGVPNEYTVIAGEGSLNQNLAMASYLGNFQEFANQVMDRVMTVEREIQSRRDQAAETLRSLDDLESQAQQERDDLAAVRQNRAALLDSTRGDETVYRNRLQQLRDELEQMGAFGRSGCARVGSHEWSDSSGYYNQCDPRWADLKLGFSDSSTIGDYGCGLVSLTMVYRRYGIQTDPIQLNARLRDTGAFVGDLMDWRNSTAASGGRLALANDPYGPMDWGRINAQLDAGNPVIVYLNRPGRQSHYVVLLERRGSTYVMHDPVEGPFLLFGDYYSPSQVYQYITFRRA